jgi:hypothetical protein
LILLVKVGDNDILFLSSRKVVNQGVLVVASLLDVIVTLLFNFFNADAASSGDDVNGSARATRGLKELPCSRKQARARRQKEVCCIMTLRCWGCFAFSL